MRYRKYMPFVTVILLCIIIWKLFTPCGCNNIQQEPYKPTQFIPTTSPKEIGYHNEKTYQQPTSKPKKEIKYKTYQNEDKLQEDDYTHYDFPNSSTGLKQRKLSNLGVISQSNMYESLYEN